MSREPEKPRRAPAADDDAFGPPDLDREGEGAPRGTGHEEPGPDAPIELEYPDESSSALDDGAALDVDPGPDELEIDEREAGLDWAAEDVDAVEADPSLGEASEGGWTEGSETGESDPWDDGDGAEEEREFATDRGEEGVDDSLASHLVEEREVVSREAHLDGDADDLDLAEDAALEAHGHEAGLAEMPRAEVPITWLGPVGESVRVVACDSAGTLLVGAGGLIALCDGVLARVANDQVRLEGEVSSLAARGGEMIVATDAGEVSRILPRGAGDPVQRPLPRPGTRDGSLGGLHVVALDTALVVLARGGGLFRTNVDEDAWIGPVVARPVRKIAGSLGAADGSEWLLALIGSAHDPSSEELLATTDARRFERVPLPARPAGVEVMGMSRCGAALALALADAPLMFSDTAGATWKATEIVDAHDVWIVPEGDVVVIYAALFHEATDRGLLVRKRVNAPAEIVLDVAHEARQRRLAGPGDPDGDGRVHGVAILREAAGVVLWVATGVGLFRIDPSP